jgi:hypothetical protein
MENLFSEIMSENSPNIWNYMSIQTLEVFRTSNGHDQNLSTSLYIKISKYRRKKEL